MRTVADLRALCAALPGSVETFPFDATTLAFKVGVGETRRMYALTGITADPLRLSLKCDPVRAQALRAAHAAVQPGHHLNKQHWNTLTLDGSLPEELVRELLRHSYDLVRRGLPSGVREAL